MEDTEAYEHPEDVVQNITDDVMNVASGQATVTAAQIIILLVWRAGSSGAARHASAAACGLGRDLEKWRHYSLIDRCKQHMAVVSIAASRIRMVTRVETMTRRISRAMTRVKEITRRIRRAMTSVQEITRRISSAMGSKINETPGHEQHHWPLSGVVWGSHGCISR